MTGGTPEPGYTPEEPEYTPEEPESEDTGTVYEKATGQAAVTPHDEEPDEEELA